MARRAERLSRLRTANLAAIIQVDKWVQKNFKQEGSLSGGGSPWKPLAPSTLAGRRKGRGVGSAKILQDKGQLKTRWKHTATARTAVLQSGVPYGDYHDRGTGTIPKRKILPTQRMVKPILKRIYKAFLKKGLK